MPLASGAFVIPGNEYSSARKESPGLPKSRKHFVTLSAFPRDSVTTLCGGEWMTWLRFSRARRTSGSPAPSLYWRAVRRSTVQSWSLKEVNFCDGGLAPSDKVFQAFKGLSQSILGTVKSICEIGYKLWCGFPISDCYSMNRSMQRDEIREPTIGQTQYALFLRCKFHDKLHWVIKPLVRLIRKVV